MAISRCYTNWVNPRRLSVEYIELQIVDYSSNFGPRSVIESDRAKGFMLTIVEVISCPVM